MANQPKLYKIRNWGKLFENNRTKELKTMSWVPIPNKQDGDGYTLIMERKNGPAIFGAWIICVQIASRCDPRGTLMRDGGKPHDARSIARMSRFPDAIVQETLELLSSPDVNWLEPTEYKYPAVGCGNTAGGCDDAAGECLEQKGTEQNGKNGNIELPFPEITDSYHKDTRVVLHFLNEHTGRHFRESDASLTPISQRLQEPGVDLELVKKMVIRQCRLWKCDPKMSEFLRPETLFGKTKFNSYYAAADLPVNGEQKAEPDEAF